MLSVLIVGCGGIAGGLDAGRPDVAWPRTHAPAYRRAGGFRLAACVEPDGTRRAAFQARWGVERGFATLAEAAAAGPFDLVSICSPTPCHAADLAGALALGPRAIFAEKPLTGKLADGRRLVAAAEAAGVALAVNHTRRWAPDVVELAAGLRAGRFGRVLGATACYTRGVRNNGTHLFDMLHLLLGPVRVVAAGTARVDQWPDDPSVPCLLEAGGVPVAVTVGDARAYALFELVLVTEAGTVAMEEGGMRWRDRPVVDSPHFPGYRAVAEGAFRPGRYEEAMTAAAVNLRAAIETGAPLACTGADALAAQAVAEALRAAATPEAEGRTPS